MSNLSKRRSKSVHGPRGPAFAPIPWTPKFLDSPLISISGSISDADELSITTSESNSEEAEVPVGIDQARSAVVSEKPPDRCVSHLDPARWVRSPLPDRLGWEEARCQDCGTFIGFNPVPESTAGVSKDGVVEPDGVLHSALRGSDSRKTQTTVTNDTLRL